MACRIKLVRTTETELSTISDLYLSGHKIGCALAVLALVTSLMSLGADATDSASSNRAAFQAFTSAPDEGAQQALLQYFSEQEVHPMMDWTPEFEEMVKNGHLLALGAAFESLSYMDGASTLHLSRLIGETILSAPEAFLWGVARYRSSIRRLGVLVGHLGTEYVDDLPGTIRALEDRYSLLRSVESQDYSEARDEVLLLLSERIYERRQELTQASHPRGHVDESE